MLDLMGIRRRISSRVPAISGYQSVPVETYRVAKLHSTSTSSKQVPYISSLFTSIHNECGSATEGSCSGAGPGGAAALKAEPHARCLHSTQAARAKGIDGGICAVLPEHYIYEPDR